MVEELFEVATEFRFDVGQAMVNTNALRGAVDNLSQSSDNALKSLNYLAGGLVARMGLGSGGLLTILSKAVQLADQFDMAANGFASTISQNMTVLAGTIHTFNDRLGTSKMILGQIADVASDVAIPTSQLSDLTGHLAGPLAAHGKLGKNFAGATDMARNLIIGSEASGINSHAAGESLYRSLNDRMPVHGQLFNRLVNTAPFQQAHVKTQMQLSNMNPDKKIDLLAKALKALAGDTDAVNARVNSLHGQLTILHNQLSDIGGVLTPIGEAIKKPLVQVLKYITDFFKKHGKEISANVAELIDSIFKDPKKLLINLMQLKAFSADFHKAFRLTGLVQTFILIHWVLSKLGIQLNGGLIMKGFRALVEGLSQLWAWLPIGKILTGVFKLLRLALLEIMPMFTLFLFIFQVISRARAIGLVKDVSNLATLMPRLTELFLRFKTAFEKIMQPVMDAIDWWAQLIAPIFETSTLLRIILPLLEGVAWSLEGMANMIQFLEHVLTGVAMVIKGFIEDLIAMKNPFSSVIDNFKAGFGITGLNERPRGKLPVAYQVTNVGKIEARFDMREQLEPDRIAFAVTNHIKRLAANPLQGRGNTLSKAFSGNNG